MQKQFFYSSPIGSFFLFISLFSVWFCQCLKWSPLPLLFLLPMGRDQTDVEKLDWTCPPWHMSLGHHLGCCNKKDPEMQRLAGDPCRYTALLQKVIQDLGPFYNPSYPWVLPLSAFLKLTCYDNYIPAHRKRERCREWRANSFLLGEWCRSCIHYFWLHPLDQNIVIWPYVASEETGKL